MAQLILSHWPCPGHHACFTALPTQQHTCPHGAGCGHSGGGQGGGDDGCRRQLGGCSGCSGRSQRLGGACNGVRKEVGTSWGADWETGQRKGCSSGTAGPGSLQEAQVGQLVFRCGGWLEVGRGAGSSNLSRDACCCSCCCTHRWQARLVQEQEAPQLPQLLLLLPLCPLCLLCQPGVPPSLAAPLHQTLQLPPPARPAARVPGGPRCPPDLGLKAPFQPASPQPLAAARAAHTPPPPPLLQQWASWPPLLADRPACSLPAAAATAPSGGGHYTIPDRRVATSSWQHPSQAHPPMAPLHPLQAALPHLRGCAERGSEGR